MNDSNLNSITVENLRLFKEETSFEFSPITILTGPNSSGKSSLFKVLLLLKEAYKTSNFPFINFESGDHNLGSFSQALSNDLKLTDESGKNIIISFPLINPFLNREIHCAILIDSENNIDLGFFEKAGSNLRILMKIGPSYIAKSNKNNDPESGNIISAAEGQFGIYIDVLAFIDMLNNCPMKNSLEQEFNPNFDYDELYTYFIDTSPNSIFVDAVDEDLKTDVIKQILQSLVSNETFIPNEYFLLKNYKKFINEIIGGLMLEYLQTIKVFQNECIEYLPAPTGYYERLIFNNQLKPYLDKFIKFFNTEHSAGNSPRDIIRMWLRIFEIDGIFYIEKKFNGFRIYLKKNESEIDLLDMGFGISKLITLMITIISCSYKQSHEKGISNRRT